MRGGPALLVVLAAAGCTTAAPSPACDDYQPPAGFDLGAPAVSFRRDVMPVFAQSCAFSSCHGATVGSANGVFLGADAARVHAGLVNARGSELASMPFVTPGDPRASFLLRKMDGSQCALDAACAGGACGDAMPKGSGPLEVATRDVVRRWIAQGAKND
jgi:hypothetical protein